MCRLAAKCCIVNLQTTMRNSVQTILLLQFLVICWSFLFVLVQCQSSIKKCNPKDDCTFICPDIPGYSDDVEIDLSSLDDSSGPKFQDIADSKVPSYTYDWNPCTEFTSGDCKNVYACQNTGSKQYSLGSMRVVFYSTESRQFIMHYLLGDDGRELNVILNYEGGEEGRVSDIVEDNDKHYTMKLYTKYAPHHGSSSSGGSGISIGTVLCIIFFTVLVLYLGIAYKYRQGAQGKDRIPNHGFWAKMPGLIKDGCIFSAKKTKECVSNARESHSTGKSREQNAAGYEEIKEES